jgi:hypothetical protein
MLPVGAKLPLSGRGRRVDGVYQCEATGVCPKGLCCGAIPLDNLENGPILLLLI